MNVQATKGVRIPTKAVTGLIVDAMIKVTVPKDDAVKIAELMLEADLVGADAHGVFRLPQYVQRLKLRSTNPRPSITVTAAHPQRHLSTAIMAWAILWSRVPQRRQSNSPANAVSHGLAAACRATPGLPAFMQLCR